MLAFLSGLLDMPVASVDRYSLPSVLSFVFSSVVLVDKVFLRDFNSKTFTLFSCKLVPLTLVHKETCPDNSIQSLKFEIHLAIAVQSRHV